MPRGPGRSALTGTRRLLSRRLLSRRHGGDRGSMSAEMVLVVPLLAALVLLLVGMGRVVLLQGDVQSAARDAARAASVERTPAAAQASAQAALSAVMTSDYECAPASLAGSDFVAGGAVQVTVSCTVGMEQLTGVGFGATFTLDSTGAAPLETYRRFG